MKYTHDTEKMRSFCFTTCTLLRSSALWVKSNTLKAGYSAFNAGCNEQLFSLKPWKKFCANSSCCFREKCTPVSKKWRFRAESYCANQLKVSFRLLKTIWLKWYPKAW